MFTVTEDREHFVAQGTAAHCCTVLLRELSGVELLDLRRTISARLMHSEDVSAEVRAQVAAETEAERRASAAHLMRVSQAIALPFAHLPEIEWTPELEAEAVLQGMTGQVVPDEDDEDDTELYEPRTDAGHEGTQGPHIRRAG